MATRHLTQSEVARRWCLSPRTLERWRWLGQGPVYLKLGGRVAYRVEDIEAYETAQARDAGAAQRPDVTRQAKATA
jgi:predicted site-specific integrase-resolvase